MAYSLADKSEYPNCTLSLCRQGELGAREKGPRGEALQMLVVADGGSQQSDVVLIVLIVLARSSLVG